MRSQFDDGVSLVGFFDRRAGEGTVDEAALNGRASLEAVVAD